MFSRLIRGVVVVAASLSLVVSAAPAANAAVGGGTTPSTASGHELGAAKLWVKAPPTGALSQEVALLKGHDLSDAKKLAEVEATPQSIWLGDDTPTEVKQTVRRTMVVANAVGRVPTFVAYDIPGRDCSQYSAGGAQSQADYAAWIRGVAAGIGAGKAIVLLEPDTLGQLPSTCAGPSASTDTERFAELNDAVDVLEAQPNTSVYLDGTHSGWLGVGQIASELVEAGVQRAQGFFLNVSNYQYTQNSEQYGTWVSECITLATQVAPEPQNTTAGFTGCPNQYTNWGRTGSEIAKLLGPGVGVKLSAYGIWSDTTTDPTLNTSGINQRFAVALGGAAPSTHFVIDTSRNAQGPNDMSAYAAAPYNHSAATVSTLLAGHWCNPPGAGIGARPTTTTGVPLVDAFLWVKTIGTSDGQCDAAGSVRAWNYSVYSQPGWPTDAAGQAAFDPLWGQIDPAAGDWFPQQTLQLLANADPAL